MSLARDLKRLEDLVVEVEYTISEIGGLIGTVEKYQRVPSELKERYEETLERAKLLL